MIRYFISQSGEWYRVSPDGKTYVLEVNGAYRIENIKLNIQELIRLDYLRERNKEQWKWACKWYRENPNQAIGGTLEL